VSATAAIITSPDFNVALPIHVLQTARERQQTLHNRARFHYLVTRPDWPDSD
jgi:hypothetical protein